MIRLEKTLTQTLQESTFPKINEVVLSSKEGDDRDMLAIVTKNEIRSAIVEGKKNKEGDYVFDFRALELAPQMSIEYFRVVESKNSGEIN